MKLVIVSSALPRRCGLAAFTDNLRTALREATGWDVDVCAIDRDGLDYGPEVVTIVRQYDAEDYRRAARSIADRGTDLVVIQHEFGIFGGADGSHVLELADELRLRGVRYAVTLHTLLSRPTPHQRATLAALCGGAVRVTVFTHEGRRLVTATGIAPADRISVVAHGAPAILRSEVDPERLSPRVAAALRSMAGAKMLSTFGLVGPGKGLDHGIEAMAQVARRHPEAHYLIAGATHPDQIRQHGEAYRHHLGQLAEKLGVAAHVHFLDAFLSEQDLAAVLRRADLFLTPYRSPEQICSGALTFAIAAGTPVVSTAYSYARELLAPNGSGIAAGVLVPCGDVDAIAHAITELFADEAVLGATRAAADRLGSTLIWPAVALKFAAAFERAEPLRITTRTVTVTHPLRLTHLEQLVDDRGITQFARGTYPDRQSGYCVDDVSRLAIVAARLYSSGLGGPHPQEWLVSSLGFLERATTRWGMHNVMDQSGHWLDMPHTGDHVGRAIWAAGAIAGSQGLPQSIRIRAIQHLRSTAHLIERLNAPRSIAYGLLGMTRWPATEFDLSILTAATRLDGLESRHPWFERILTYDNARLPQALLEAGAHLGNDDMTSRALSTLDWYLTHVGLSGSDPVLRLVGNGWRDRASGPSAREGDEQPIDAAATVDALVSAWRHTRKQRYADLALRAFAWFHGVNRAGVHLYDTQSGGCRDGLSAVAANANEGAESTLAYLQALLTLNQAGLVNLLPDQPGIPAPAPASPTPLPPLSPLPRNRSAVHQ